MQRLARPAWALAALVALLGLSAFLRTRALDASLWIDEGISAGIASHPAGEIPGLLRQDGSPPAYYLLLHAWTALAGTTEAALRLPSLVFALLAIPAALWGGRSLFGPTAGWICAAAAAVLPFLTTYAQEARMYALVALLSLLATASFVHAFVLRRRRYVPVFAGLLALLLYTHYWSLFLALGALAALGALVTAAAPEEERRPLALDGALAFGFAALAFGPWVPTLAFQIEHTGAPWSNPPPLAALAAVVALAAAAAIVSRLGVDARERRALGVLGVFAVVTLASAWAAALAEPGWALRYLAVLVGPLLLLAGAGLARLGPPGILAAAAVSCAWALDLTPAEKSNVARVSSLASALEPGDLVVSTQPEQVPVLDHYLPDGLRFATPLGPVPDPSIMDWRNALSRLQGTRPELALAPLLDALPPGARVLLVAPETGDGRWHAPWTRLVARRSDEWALALGADPRFRLQLGAAPHAPVAKTGVRLALYTKAAAGGYGS